MLHSWECMTMLHCDRKVQPSCITMLLHYTTPQVARLQQGSLEMESLCEEMSNHNQHLEDKLAAMEVEADFASQLLTDTSDANTQLTLNMETTKHQLQEQQAQGASLREEVGTKQEAWEQANLELARVTLALQDANTAAAALVCEHHAREQSYTAAATFLLACHNVKTMSMEAQHELSAGFFRLARGAHLHQARSPPKWPYPSRSGSPVSKLRQPQVAPIRERARYQAKEAGRWTRAIAAEHADPRLQEASRPSSRLEAPEARLALWNEISSDSMKSPVIRLSPQG